MQRKRLKNNMEKEKYIRVSITIPPSLWKKFKEKCDSDYKTASGSIQELIFLWVNENKIR